MEFLRMESKNTQAVLELWQEVFGDTKEETTIYLQEFVEPKHEFVAMEEEKLCAILSAVPCTLAGRAGVYFFALATAPAMRGKGVMQTLMQYAEETCAKEGAIFSCLVPASHSLFSYYEKAGYRSLFQRRVRLALQKEASGLSLREQNLLALPKVRGKYHTHDFIVLQDSSFQLALREAKETGFRLVESEEGYAVFWAQDACLPVAELWAKTDREAYALLHTLGKQYGCKEAVVHLSKGSSLFLGKGCEYKAAQWKKLANKELSQQEPRLYFALDALFEKDYDRFVL